jgi:hypothetical protein
MHTSILVLAFSGFAPSANSDTPTWLNDYHAGVRQAAAQKKPLAVFLAAGVNGWRKVGQDNRLSHETQRILASQYVCVHVDTATPEGERFARVFEIPSGLGIVISDRTAQVQAFSHEGDLTDAKMVRYLTRYGASNYVVFTTETNPAGHAEPVYAPPAQTFRPAMRSC